MGRTKLGGGAGRLLYSEGGAVVTSPPKVLGKPFAKLRHGACLTVVGTAQQSNVQQIHATCNAFAAILADGTVVTWGVPSCGGDSTTVRAQLKNVQQICSTQDAFAAVLADGTVVAWGNPDLGGDSTAVQDRLNGVEKIRSTMSSSSTAVEDQLKNVQQVYATCNAFAALLAHQ